jgi:hypothetical protein
MDAEGREESIFERFKSGGRKSIRLSEERLIKTGLLDEEGKFGLVVEPDADGVNLIAWAGGNLAFIDQQLIRHGAILFRGFRVEAVSQFREFAGAVSRELLSYNERAAPRLQIDEAVYTSTEYPADHTYRCIMRCLILTTGRRKFSSIASSRRSNVEERRSPTTARFSAFSIL